ncbi:MAG TPA: hypothetical protein VFS20_18205 [Longimicrobium sp.]|nr:hypothetical protein [Longimicrobium sp.]
MTAILTDEALAERLEKLAKDVRRFDPTTRAAMVREAARRIRLAGTLQDRGGSSRVAAE